MKAASSKPSLTKFNFYLPPPPKLNVVGKSDPGCLEVQGSGDRTEDTAGDNRDPQGGAHGRRTEEAARDRMGLCPVWEGNT